MGQTPCWNCHKPTEDDESRCPHCDVELDAAGGPVLRPTGPGVWGRRLRLAVTICACLLGTAGAFFLHQTGMHLPLLRVLVRETALLRPISTERRKKSPAPDKRLPGEITAPALPKWHVRGKVYDLLSAKPIPNVQITFRRDGFPATQKRVQLFRYKAITDRSGHFKIGLPKIPTGGYHLELDHPKYGTTFVEDSEPPYAARSAERRRQVRDELSALTQLHVPILPKMQDSDYQLDLVLYGK